MSSSGGSFEKCTYFDVSKKVCLSARAWGAIEKGHARDGVERNSERKNIRLREVKKKERERERAYAKRQQ